MTKNNSTAAQQADAAFSPPAVVETPPEVAKSKGTQARIKEAQAIVARASAIQVTNPEEYVAAGEVLQNLRGKFKELEEDRKEMTDPIRLGLNRLMEFFKPHTEAVTVAGKLVTGKMTAYDAEQRRIADEARAKAEAEAERQRKEAQRKADEERAEARRKEDAQRAEAERLRKQQEAEAQRVRDEQAAAEKAQRDADEARRRGDAEAAAAAQREKDAADQRARDAQAASDAAAKAASRADSKADAAVARGEEKAQAQEAVATSIVAPTIITEAPKVAGIARRLEWKAEVTDFPALVRAVAEGKAPMALLQPNDKVIGQQARSLQADFKVDGVRVWSEGNIAARSK